MSDLRRFPIFGGSGGVAMLVQEFWKCQIWFWSNGGLFDQLIWFGRLLLLEVA